jgi:hypothetical protein
LRGLYPLAFFLVRLVQKKVLKKCVFARVVSDKLSRMYLRILVLPNIESGTGEGGEKREIEFDDGVIEEFIIF